MAIVLLATGCAPAHWEKPGADAAGAESDLLACRQSAQVTVGRDPALNSIVRPAAAGNGLVTMQSSQELNSERQMREFLATQECMRAKDYQLKPAAAR